MNTENQKTKNTWQRKLLSLNWWLCGEVNPTVHPSSPHYPRFWRKDIVAFYLFIPCAIMIWLSAALLNDRSLPFNENKQYIGTIKAYAYVDPQIIFESRDHGEIYIGTPTVDMLGFPERYKRPREHWKNAVDMLISGQHTCPDRVLIIHGEEWKATFNPVVRMWSVECFKTRETLLSEEYIKHTYLTSLKDWTLFGLLTNAVLGVFIAWIAISRERIRYQKHMNSISKNSTQGA